MRGAMLLQRVHLKIGLKRTSMSCAKGQALLVGCLLRGNGLPRLLCAYGRWNSLNDYAKNIV